MPKACCAYNCYNRDDGSTPYSFYRIPAGGTPFEKKRRELWLNAIYRKDWPVSKQKNARLCGAHFISGKRSYLSTHPDFVPSLFAFPNVDETKSTQSSSQKLSRFERCKQHELKKSQHESQQAQERIAADLLLVNTVGDDDSDGSGHGANLSPTHTGNCTPETDSVTLPLHEFAMNSEEMRNLRSEVFELCETNERLAAELARSRVLGFSVLKTNATNFKCYTGITVPVFLWLLDLCERNIPSTDGPLLPEDNLLLVLIKLRLGLLNLDLALRFKIKSEVVTICINVWLPVLAGICSQLVVWPEKHALRCTLPTSFSKKFKRAVCIIDCTEIFIERPSSLTARAQTWSNYKHHNTIKYFVCCSPAGGICLLPPGWGGRTSDKEVTLNCGFREKIEYGDEILADRGFNIAEELALLGAILHVPAYCRGKSQLSHCEVDTSRQLARVRIHVERVIGRMKNFRILQQTIPISQIHHLDNFVITIAGLVNLNDRIV